MRLGYVLTSPGVAEELRKIVPPFHLNLFAAVFGQVLWERKSLFDDRVAELVAERARLAKAVRGLSGVRIYPSEANFFLMELDRAAEVHAALASRGVLVRKQGGDPRLENCLRVNAGTKEENDRFLADLKEVLASL